METSNIESDFVVLSPGKDASLLQNSSDVFERLHQSYGDFKGHELISCFSFSENWGNWELHPKGDEIVLLLSGRVTFILDIDGEHTKVQLSEPGDYVVVPKNTWHTAHTSGLSKVLFITPGEGTEHKDI